jgi:hypothetical protein
MSQSREPYTTKLAQSSYCLKCASYWQSVLRFGLPWIILYRAIDYVSFRVISRGGRALRYAWQVSLPIDLGTMLFVALLWWLLMREIAAWKRKSAALDK